MPKGGLTCGGGCFPGSKAVLWVKVQGRRVAFLCEACARDDYSLRSFLVAAGWLHGWRTISYEFVGRGLDDDGLLFLLSNAIEEEFSRAAECHDRRLRLQQAWAVGVLGALRPLELPQPSPRFPEPT